MAYFLDAIVVVVFLLSLYLGYRRGFIKTISHLVAMVAALLVTLLCSGALAEAAFDRAVTPAVEKAITQTMEQAGADSAQALDAALEKLPGFLQQTLSNQGITDGAALAAKLNAGSGASAQLAEQVTQQVIRPATLPLLKLLCGIVLFLVVLIVARILMGMLDKVFRLPVLRTLNGTLGLVGGALTGVVWALLAVSVIQVIAASGGADASVNPAVLSQTHVVQWLAQLNPLSSALQEILAQTGK